MTRDTIMALHMNNFFEIKKTKKNKKRADT